MKNENKVKSERHGKIKVRFRYTNGHYEIYEFSNDKQIGWFVHENKDHLLDYEIINDKTTCSNS